MNIKTKCLALFVKLKQMLNSGLKPIGTMSSHCETPADNSHGDLVPLVWEIEKLRRKDGGCTMNELITEVKKNFKGLESIKHRSVKLKADGNSESQHKNNAVLGAVRCIDKMTGRIRIAYHINEDGAAFNKSKTLCIGVVGLDLIPVTGSLSWIDKDQIAGKCLNDFLKDELETSPLHDISSKLLRRLIIKGIEAGLNYR